MADEEETQLQRLTDAAGSEVAAVAERLGVDVSRGLSSEAAAVRLLEHGENRVFAQKVRSVLPWRQHPPHEYDCAFRRRLYVTLRDGVLSEVLASSLVPGDVVLLRSNDEVPADCRVCEATYDCAVDCSQLTGEAEPIRKRACVEDVGARFFGPCEAANLVLEGSVVAKGALRALVLATGNRTVMSSFYGHCCG